MARTSLNVRLLTYTPIPQEVVAMGARLCYSDAGVDELAQGVSEKDQSKYLQRLMDMGHLSPIEHCSFSFGIEGVSRALLAQITRHRLASFSVQSQRYVSKANEQGCFSYILPPAIEALGEEAVAEYDRQMMTMQQWYNDWQARLGNAGEASNEDARFVLPNAAETRMVLTMNARELLHSSACAAATAPSGKSANWPGRCWPWCRIRRPRCSATPGRGACPVRVQKARSAAANRRKSKPARRRSK